MTCCHFKISLLFIINCQFATSHIEKRNGTFQHGSQQMFQFKLTGQIGHGIQQSGINFFGGFPFD